MNISKSQYRALLQLSGLALGSALAVYGMKRLQYPYGRLGSNLRALGQANGGPTNPLAALRRKLPARPVSRMTHLLPASHVLIKRSVTINRPAQELYDFWRKFENLPKFMNNLYSVTALSDTKSVWVVQSPGGSTTAWDTEIVTQEENETLRWRSQIDEHFSNLGLVRFTPTADERGTEVSVVLEYEQPGGRLGAALARLLGENPDDQIREDLRRFKSLMEAGEIPTTKNQSSARN